MVPSSPLHLLRRLAPLACLLALTAGQACSSDDDSADNGGSGSSGKGGKGGSSSGSAGAAGSSAGSGGSAGQGGSAGAAGASAGGSAGAQAGGQAGSEQGGSAGQAGSAQAGEAGQAGSAQAGGGGSSQAGSAGSSQAGGAGSSQAGSAGSSQAGAAGQAGGGGAGGSEATCDNSKVNIGLVLDRSNSMRARPEGGLVFKNTNQWAKSKMAIAISAVNTVVGKFEAISSVQYDFALNLFPDNKDCPTYKQIYGCPDYPTKSCGCGTPSGTTCTTTQGATFKCEYKDDPFLGAGCYLSEITKASAACAATGDISEPYLGDKKLEDIPLCGSTPIGFALKASGDALLTKASVYPRVLILVTDGGETCQDQGSDPVKTAKALYDGGITTRVITFSEATKTKLQPVADAGNGGGGSVYVVSAKDDAALDDLTKALDDIISTAPCKP